ncbi:MAG: hypothetical protein V3W04_07865 [Gammaproteobacteria bacterium]
MLQINSSLLKLLNSQSLASHDKAELFRELKAGIEQLSMDELPLQQNLTQSSYVSGDTFNAMILQVTDSAEKVLVKAGIFYKGVIAGCNCADDPSPVDELTEYCELHFEVDKKQGRVSVV